MKFSIGQNAIIKSLREVPCSAPGSSKRRAVAAQTYIRCQSRLRVQIRGIGRGRKSVLKKDTMAEHHCDQGEENLGI